MQILNVSARNCLLILISVPVITALGACSSTQPGTSGAVQRLLLTKAEASKNRALIANNSEIKLFLAQLDEPARSSVVFTAARVRLRDGGGSQLFVRLVSREVCDGRLCPVFLIGGRSERFVTMLEHQARGIALLSSLNRRDYRPFKLYFEGPAYADFYCTRTGCSTPS